MKNQSQRRGRAYEGKKLVKDGYKKQPLSGAGWKAKQDNTRGIVMVQAKHTDAARSYTLLKEDLRKLALDAAMVGKVPVLMLDFAGDEYSILRKSDYEAYSIDSYEELIEQHNELKSAYRDALQKLMMVSR